MSGPLRRGFFLTHTVETQTRGLSRTNPVFKYFHEKKLPGLSRMRGNPDSGQEMDQQQCNSCTTWSLLQRTTGH